MKKQLSLVFMALMLMACPVWGQKKSDMEKHLEKIGLQNVAEEIPGIEVYMVYATPYNFMGRVLYEGLDEAYLVPEAMEKLRKANEILRKKRMDLHLVVYDAARPRAIQEQMWKVVAPHSNRYGISVHVLKCSMPYHSLNKNECCSLCPVTLKTSTFSVKDSAKTLSICNIERELARQCYKVRKYFCKTTLGWSIAT